MKSYKFWILQSIRYLYDVKQKRNIKLEISKIIQFEQKLAELLERSHNEKMTFHSLQMRFPYQWEQAFKLLIVEKGMKFGKQDTLIIKNVAYFMNVFNFLQRTDPILIGKFTEKSQMKHFIIYFQQTI